MTTQASDMPSFPVVSAASVASVALLWSCPVLALGAQAADPRPPALEHTVDASIKPGDDFFAYANGA